MAKRKPRVSLTDSQKNELKKFYKDNPKTSITGLGKRFGVSSSTAGRIVGIYPQPVYKPEYQENRMKAKRSYKKRTKQLDNGLGQLQSYLDGLREGIIVRVADTDPDISKYVNGWDDCAEAILKKIKEYI